MAKKPYNLLAAAGILASSFAAYASREHAASGIQPARTYDSGKQGIEMIVLAQQSAVNQDSAVYEVKPANGQVDTQKVFFGTISDVKKSYQKIGFIDYQAITRATPEFEEVQNKKIEPGTGKYWILLSAASDRVVRAISKYATDNQLEFVADQSYIGSLDIKVNGQQCDASGLSITQPVIDLMNDKKSQ